MELLPDPLPAPLPMPPIPSATPTPLEYESAQFVPGKGGLIAMSVIFFLIGVMTGCGTLAIPFFMMSVRRGGGPQVSPQVSPLITILVTYGAIAIASIWTGVACCRARRWVRPVILAAAWPWLLLGGVGLISMIIVLGHAQPRTAAFPANTAVPSLRYLPLLTMLIPAIIGTVTFVGIPTLLIWFFQRRQTAQTLWFYDPVPGWADRCPIPVLAWSLWNGLGALGVLGSLANGSVALFGFLITGAPAAGIIVFVSAIMLCAAVGSYLLKPWAWWLSLAQSVVLAASWLTLLLRGRLPEFVAQQQQHTMATTAPSAQQLSMLTNPWFLSMSVMGMLLWLGFVVYLRRYFVPPSESASLPAASRS